MTSPHQSHAVPYTDDDVSQLTKMFHSGSTWAGIANSMSRTIGSVRQKAYSLGLRRYLNGNIPKPDPAAKTIYNRRYQKANPEKRLAHKAVEHALLSGEIAKQPCEFCGSEEVHAHHTDYEKPLDVNWLCCSCHSRIHSILRKTKASPSTNCGRRLTTSPAFSEDRG